MSDIVLIDPAAHAAPSRNRLFSGAMLAVTIFPILAVPLFGGTSNGTISDLDLLWLIFFFARGHVALTVLFYFDRAFRTLATSQPGRFIVAPLMIVGALPFLLMANETLFKASVFLVFAWNIWHFHKQNMGVLSLICISNGQRPPDRYARLLAGLACAAGIASFVPRQFASIYGDGAFLFDAAALDTLLFAALLGLIVLSAFASLARWGTQNGAAQIFYFASVSVYSIVFLLPGEIVYFAMAQATAHGLQYAIMVYAMGPASGLAHPRPPEPRKTARLIYACLVWTVLLLWSLFILKGDHAARLLDDLLGTSAVLSWVQAFAVAALLAHFIVDGGAFKLREQGPREWMQSRIGRLLSH